MGRDPDQTAWSRHVDVKCASLGSVGVLQPRVRSQAANWRCALSSLCESVVRKEGERRQHDVMMMCRMVWSLCAAIISLRWRWNKWRTGECPEDCSSEACCAVGGDMDDIDVDALGAGVGVVDDLCGVFVVVHDTHGDGPSDVWRWFELGAESRRGRGNAFDEQCGVV